MVMGSQQLAEEYAQLKEFLEFYPKIVILTAEGEAPDNYDIEYQLRGYCRDKENNVTVESSHQIRLSLPFGYPHFAPIAKPLTSVFHPDFDPAAIRIADQWQNTPSLPELVLHIGEMICGRIYNLENPFQQEAADWYKAHSSQLPLDKLERVDKPAILPEPEPLLEPAPQPQLDEIVEDTFVSLGLEDEDFLGPENKVAPSEIDYIRELVAENKIFSANKLLADLPVSADFPDREEIQQTIGKVLRKTDQLFKLAEQLEDMGKFAEAVEVTDNLLAIASDAPGAESLRERIKQSAEFSVPSPPEIENPKPEKAMTRTHPPLANTAQPGPKSSSTTIPFKPIFLALLVLGFSIGLIALYFKDQDTLSQSQANILKGQILLEKNQFDAALDALESAKGSLSSLTILRFQKNSYENKIGQIIGSPELQEGLKGRILYQGEYISADTVAALKKLHLLREQGAALRKNNKVSDALNLYRQALLFCQEHNLIKEQEPLHEVIQSLELQLTLSFAERAEKNNNWAQAAEAYRKALTLSSNIQTLGTISDITHRLTAATFRHDLNQSKRAFTQSQWEETIKFLEQAQTTIDANPNVVTRKERDDLHKLLVNARLYLLLTKAREAYEGKSWNRAIVHYQNALMLLKDEPDTTGELVSDSVDKIGRTLLLVRIAQIQEQVFMREGASDHAGVVAKSNEILQLIRNSGFATEPAVQAVQKKVQLKIVEQQTILDHQQRIAWLEENFDTIFRDNYPTFRGSTLEQPKAVFTRKKGNKSLYTLTCIEKSQGTSSKLELLYMFNPANASWSVPRE